MKLSILGKMIPEDFKSKIETAARFYASELMSTRMCNTLTIRIEIRRGGKHFKDNDYLGMAYKNNTGSKVQKKHLLILQYTQTQTDIFEVLAHEMVHIKQSALNEYQMRRYKSDKRIHARWRGVEVGIYENIPYNQRPWEVEAFSMQKELYSKLIKNKIIKL